MPVYNAAPYLAEALNSILSQTFDDFELIIIDDCSTDNTPAIIFAIEDCRVRKYFKEKNTGYTNSLNKGLTLSHGKYIARMDADDISEKHRFQEQVAFLEQHPDFGIVGSYVSTIPETGLGGLWKFPEKDADIRTQLLANSPFAHPAVMMRKELLIQNNICYDPEFEPCEDYKLWVQLLKITKGYNIPKVLLNYRLSNTQTISIRKQELINKSNSIRSQLITDLTGYTPLAKEAKVHYYLFNEPARCTQQDITERWEWKNKLLKHLTQQPAYKAFINEVFNASLKTLGEFSPKLLKLIKDDSIRGWTKKQQIIFVIKCLLFYKSRSIIRKIIAQDIAP